ncbi:hypothetical protein MZM54_04125 [[Brevibacterium] frigoritolerans]|nr:hypothetical protein [Peribacillus frigoritolerans]
MYKKLLVAILSLALFLPTGVSAATSGTTNASISINPGTAGFAQLITNNLIFQAYTIGSGLASQGNSSTHTFRIEDFSGGLNGWTVSAIFSDFVLDKNSDGTPEDKLSSHNTTIDLKCGTTTFKSQPHSCQTNINRALTTIGTTPSVIVSAPANDTSVGVFSYTIPGNFFVLNFQNDVQPGTYNGTLTIDFASVYTP